MTKRNNFIILSIGLFAVSAAYNFYLIKIPIGMYDEGIILAAADRILNGERPYADFWGMYPPGQFYTLALLFKLFGTSILTERMYDILIRTLLSLCSFFIIRKICSSNTLAIIGWGMSLILLGSEGFSAYPIYTAILLIFLGIYFFLHSIETDKTHYLIYSGIFMALGALFRHDLAGMAAISALISLFLPADTGKGKKFRSVSYFLFGIASAGVPIALSLISTIGIHPIIHQLLLTPPEIMPKYRWLPYPSGFCYYSIKYYIYPFILFAGLLSSSVLIFGYKIHNSLSHGLFLLSLTGILFGNQVRVRSDDIHLFPTGLLASVAGPILLSVLIASGLKHVKPLLNRIGASLLFIMLMLPLIGPVYDKLRDINDDYFTIQKSLLDRAGYADVSKDTEELIGYIKGHTVPTDAIYVGVTNHDQFIINDVAVYFLAGRRYATKYHELHPGVSTTSVIQKEIIQELSASSPKLMVLAPRYWYEPNDTVIDSRVDLLDRYIAVHYKMAAKFGPYEIHIPIQS